MTLEKPRILFKALLWSVLLHLLIARAVALTFQVHEVSPRPVLVFWGGILSPQEFIRLSESSAPPLETTAPKLFPRPRQAEKSSSPNFSLPKPALTSLTPQAAKESYKSSLDEFPLSGALKEQKDKDPLLELGIDPEPPGRPPLKLYEP